MIQTATAFVRNFGQRKFEVLKEPIEVVSHGQTIGYYISPEAYEKFRKLEDDQRRSYTLETLPEGDLDSIIKTLGNPDPEQLRLDKEQDDLDGVTEADMHVYRDGKKV